jgi:hypothetical protein
MSGWRAETDHPGGVVICGDCDKPLHHPGYHLWGPRDNNGRREKVCVDEPIFARAYGEKGGARS